MEEIKTVAEIGQYLSAIQLSQALSVSRSCILSLAQRGILPAGIKLGRSRRWRLDDVKRVLTQLNTEGGEDDDETETA